MQILALYCPEDSAFYNLWERSWRTNGWKPGLITPKEVAKHGSLKAAAAARGARLVCSARTINVSFKPPHKTPVRIHFITYGKRGWETAPVIQYPKNFSAPV